MLTILEILIILLNILVLIWPLLPVKKVPRFLDFMPLAAVIAMVLHLFVDHEAVTARFGPLYIFTITLFLITIGRIFKHNPNQPKRRVLAVIGRIFQIGLLVICVLVPTVIIPFYSLPEPTGTFDVGTVVMDFTDNNRIETLSKKREKTVKLLYSFGTLQIDRALRLSMISIMQQFQYQRRNIL